MLHRQWNTVMQIRHLKVIRLDEFSGYKIINKTNVVTRYLNLEEDCETKESRCEITQKKVKEICFWTLC